MMGIIIPIGVMSTDDLIQEVEAYANERGLAPATIISRAVNNGRLYGRLKAGFGCNMKTAERIRAFMAENPPNTSGGTA